jgi:hypothetical protein
MTDEEEAQRYLRTKGLFIMLCNRTGVPVPSIRTSRSEDPCDFTSHNAVRLNVQAAADLTPERHAAHVFGHYLCDLHEWGNRENQPICDEVADVIADLLDEIKALEEI